MSVRLDLHWFAAHTVFYMQDGPRTVVRRSLDAGFILSSSLLNAAGLSLCVDALTIAILVDERGRWYVPTKSLELVCLDLCVAYRSCWDTPPRKVMVTTDTPRCLWLHGKSPAAQTLPPCPVRAVTVKE